MCARELTPLYHLLVPAAIVLSSILEPEIAFDLPRLLDFFSIDNPMETGIEYFFGKKYFKKILVSRCVGHALRVHLNFRV